MKGNRYDRIAVSSQQLHQIRRHAEQTYPQECCGLLLGTSSDRGKHLVEVVPTENCWDEGKAESFATIAGGNPRTGSKESSFSIAPEVMLRVQKQARDRNLKIIGIYHSHPNAPAIPSEFDRAIAWPEYSYLIVAVPQGKAAEILSWVLDEKGQFQPEQIIEDSPSA